MLPFGYKLSTWLHQRLYMMPVGFFREFRARGGRRGLGHCVLGTRTSAPTLALMCYALQVGWVRVPVCGLMTRISPPALVAGLPGLGGWSTWASFSDGLRGWPAMPCTGFASGAGVFSTCGLSPSAHGSLCQSPR